MPSPLCKSSTQYIPEQINQINQPIHMKKSITTAKNNLFLALDDVRRPLPSLHRSPMGFNERLHVIQ